MRYIIISIFVFASSVTPARLGTKIVPLNIALSDIIQKMEPKTKLAHKLSNSIIKNCNKTEYLDIIVVSYLESNFRNIKNKHTEDYGPYQLSNYYHKGSKNWSLDQQTRYACELIKKAKNKGTIGIYHSKTKKHQVKWLKKFNRNKSKLLELL